jgi:amino acid adenylation domain-containing protein
MAGDSRPAALLTQAELRGLAAEVCDLPALCLDAETDAEAGEAGDTIWERPALTGADLAYVIYTSGSTGAPKGAMNTHAAILNRLLWMQGEYGLGAADVVLQKTPTSFDVSVWELFWPLMCGAKLVMARPGGHKDPGYLREVIEKENVTTLHFVPSMLGVFVEAVEAGRCASLRRVICSGEALPSSLWLRFRERFGAELHNLYGPTEAAVDVTYRACKEGEVYGASVPIGRPVANTQVYVLDASLGPCPVGAAGELYIGGVQLGRGYLNRPALTAERFIPDPFSREPGARLYRTGDVARYLPGGEVEYLGRVDHQVKVRGFRIELGEVEAALRGCEGVREAAVVVREAGPGDKRIVAYVVGEAGEAPAAGALRRQLRERLPEYMVPSAFVPLGSLPLMLNGKVNRRALPAPGETSDEAREYVAPRTPAEGVVARVWAGVLKVERVGATDNFFELGGHSLLATQVVSRLREAFGVELPVRSLFEEPTVEGLAALVERELRAAPAAGAPGLGPVERGGELPLSFAQQRLWFLDQLEPGSSAYHIPIALRFEGQLDVAALGRSIEEVVRRHESLRTTFRFQAGGPVQVVRPAGAVELPVTDLSHLPAEGREAEARRLAIEEARKTFDLTRGPLVRAGLLRLAAEEHVALLTMHHIVSDGWSMGVLVKEVAALYEAFAAGQESPLPELPIQYPDYAAWQREWLQGEALEEQLSYWREKLAGAPPVLELPTDRPRPAVQTFRGAREQFTLPATLAAELAELSRGEGVTLFMTLLAAWQALLSRYARQQDVVVGTPVAGRSRPELEPLIGFFVNTLALRTDLSGNPTFRELLGRVREVCLGAYAHQEVPFEKLVEELQPQRNLSHAPLFQVMLVLQNQPQEAVELPGLRISAVRGENLTAKFDLTLILEERAGELAGVLEYNSDLFDAGTAARMAAQFRTLLDGVAADPDRRLARVSLLDEAEEREQLRAWNETAAEFPADFCLHQLFEAQAARTPDALAVVGDGGSLTYAELDRRANRVAHALRRLGVGPEERVGLLAGRSVEMVVGLWGVLKAGGAYVPLDPQHPAAHLRHLVEDSRARVVLTLSQLAEAIPRGAGVEVLCLDGELATAAGADESKPADSAAPANLAYVIYTSGSTGRPKGVMAPHRALVNYLSWAARAYATAEGGGAAVHSPLGSDLTVTGLFLPLLTGRPVRLLPEQGALEALGAALGAAGDATLFKLTPTQLTLLKRLAPREGAGGAKLLVVGGEALKAEHLSFWAAQAERPRVVNEYGSTETVVGCCAYEVDWSQPLRPRVPIGRPIANARLYLLDEEGRPAPAGVPGEIHVGGEAVSRGYLGLPALTAERFVPDPFSAEPGARLYRTGDLARRLPDGDLEYLGRTDTQVRVGGFRVEVGEIEAALAARADVGETAVTAREDAPGDVRLVAYFVPARRESPPAPAELRNYLRSKLPAYLMPSAFVALEALPLLPNGKLDRAALPAPEPARREPEETYVAPRSDVERRIAEVWRAVLRVERVGVNDNFFDLGGNSLLMVQAHAELQEIAGRAVSIVELFQHPTVDALAGLFSRGGGEELSAEKIQNRAAKQKGAQAERRERARRRRDGGE